MSDYLRYYVPGGTYFFTVNTYGRYPFFGEERAIDLLRESWNTIQKESPFINIASVLLPDHFHCLWSLPSGDMDFSTRLKRIKDGFTEPWLASGGYEVPVTDSQNEKGIEAFGNDDSGSIAFGMRGTLRTILITSITTQPNMAIDSGPPIGLIRQFTSTSKWGITTRTGAARSLPTSKISNSNSPS